MGVGRMRHPVDLPEEHHAAPRAQSWQEGVEAPGGASTVGVEAAYCAQDAAPSGYAVDGMPHEPPACKIKDDRDRSSVSLG